ncbi:response regulator [Chryseobacterium indoltheticum]|uniref:Transcriptional regulatory protein YycF n=1 Tax=Chryseobacterium indoltheticum TaxID=254 RepID=A0A381FBN4_9FLAO|nr:response regulator [Chryseobacterium indoltheticum]AZA73736.1 response regulator [Chryseobacterium indoltheticum]SIQ93358.1 two-component system, cell cycle response regulator DivK [Chryseobacterium indoltheticum]SUX43883.1 Transcriptional regulatory protein YycF [Chryseobacterium indoltheticum]
MDRKRILIFDDDVPLLDVLQIIFTEGGYEVEVSQSSNNVVECVSTFQPDLILMDYLIPEIGGAEAIKTLRNNQKFNKVPVILVSATTNIAKIKNTSGANDYLRKPFDIDDLETIVNKYLS